MRVWGKPDGSGIAPNCCVVRNIRNLWGWETDELGLGAERGPEPHQEAESTGTKMNSGERD